MLDLPKLSYRAEPPIVIVSAAPQVWNNCSLTDGCQLYAISQLLGPTIWNTGSSGQP